MSPELEAALIAARRRYDAMTPEQQSAMWEAQRQSFIRAFGPCEHGEYDWEDCPQCLVGAAQPIDNIPHRGQG